MINDYLCRIYTTSLTSSLDEEMDFKPLLLVNKYCCVHVSDGHDINIVPDSIRLQNINFNALLLNYFERSLEQLL